MMPGDSIGAGDIFRPDRKSSFEFSALTNMKVLVIEPPTFMAVSQQVEKRVSTEREKYLKKMRDTSYKSFGNAKDVHEDVILQIHHKALTSEHYVPRRLSGNDLIFECGKADEVLTWLEVRGLLSYKGSIGWEIAQNLPDEER